MATDPELPPPPATVPPLQPADPPAPPDDAPVPAADAPAPAADPPAPAADPPAPAADPPAPAADAPVPAADAPAPAADPVPAADAQASGEQANALGVWVTNLVNAQQVSVPFIVIGGTTGAVARIAYQINGGAVTAATVENSSYSVVLTNQNCPIAGVYTLAVFIWDADGNTASTTVSFSVPPLSRIFAGLTGSEWWQLLRTLLVPALLYVVLAVGIWLIWGQQELWLAFTVLVPGFLISQQGVYLRAQKPKWTRVQNRYPEYWKEAEQQADMMFGIPAIAVDYYLPALLAAVAGGVVGFALSYVKNHRETLGDPAEQEVYGGIVLGAMGAYVYVVINLAQRTFRRDVTPGIAVWSAAQLLVGPILGGFVAAVLRPTAEPSGYSHQILYFFAGLAPREIVSIIQNIARRSAAGAQAQQAPARLIPLQTVAGIDQSVADRLLEEGVTDGYQLALANPVRLYRNTPYDMRQILAWMDQCLLVATLPDYADALRKAGINSATALADLWKGNPDNWGEWKGTPPKWVENPAKFQEDVEKLVKALKPLEEKIGLNAVLLKDVILRLSGEPQQKRIWSLSQETDM